MLEKARWIGKFAEFAYTSLESDQVEVSFYGHAAIVRCVQRSHSTWRGQDMALTVRVSQTWVELLPHISCRVIPTGSCPAPAIAPQVSA